MKSLSRQELAAIWAKVPPDYYFKLNRLQKLWHEWKWLVFKYLIELDGSPPHRILEVGCASGHLSGIIAEHYSRAEVTGIDIYAPAVREARRRYPGVSFHISDAHTLPFKSGYFDLVVCSETIEHVVKPGRVLHEIARVLKPHGRALIEMDSGSIPFRLVWWFWTQWGRGKVWKNAHLHPFSSRELESLIASNGFIIKKRVFSHFGMAVSFLVSHRE